MLSVVIPVYRNEANLDRLLGELNGLAGRAPVPVEVVFVIDGSPDRCAEILRERLPGARFSSRLVLLSRNFGSFNAIRGGLAAASGEYFAGMAADLQEPPDLALEFLETLRADRADIAFGIRATRSDPWPDDLAARLFWFASWR
jgi:glycosyltransferase involved in cell wall biosynthesis